MIQESYQQQQKSHNEKESESRQEKIAKEAIKIKTFVKSSPKKMVRKMYPKKTLR